jgi:hypothetical protein
VLHRVRGYAFLQQRRNDEAAVEFQQSVDAARSSGALYELALSLQAAEVLHGTTVTDGEAERLLEALDVSTLPNVPLG